MSDYRIARWRQRVRRYVVWQLSGCRGQRRALHRAMRAHWRARDEQMLTQFFLMQGRGRG